MNVPGDPSNLDSLEAISGWALQSGADRVALGLSMGQEASFDALFQALPTLSLEVPDPLRAFLEGKKPQQQALPLVLGGDGLLRVSDDVDALGSWQEKTPETLWTSGSKRIEQALSSSRPFDEVELLPEVLVSLR